MIAEKKGENARSKRFTTIHPDVIQKRWGGISIVVQESNWMKYMRERVVCFHSSFKGVCGKVCNTFKEVYVKITGEGIPIIKMKRLFEKELLKKCIKFICTLLYLLQDLYKKKKNAFVVKWLAHLAMNPRAQHQLPATAVSA